MICIENYRKDFREQDQESSLTLSDGAILKQRTTNEYDDTFERYVLGFTISFMFASYGIDRTITAIKSHAGIQSYILPVLSLFIGTAVYILLRTKMTNKQHI